MRTREGERVSEKEGDRGSQGEKSERSKRDAEKERDGQRGGEKDLKGFPSLFLLFPS